MAKPKFGPAEFTGKAPDPSNLPSLRELDEADGILQQFLQETEGEVTPEIEGLEAWLKDATVGKFLRWGLWLRDRYAEIEWLKGQAAPFKTEYDRIMARAKALENSVDWSEGLLLAAMRRFNLPFVKSPLIAVKRQNNPDAVAKNGEVVTEKTELPTDVLQRLFDNEATRHLIKFTPESYTLDKNAVKAAIKVNALPDSLKEIGIGLVHGERIEIT